ncbi:MAG: phosphatase PAP2 family protein [Planctomycetota bacterium]|nr:phosphatase PAP2 family protein [Planctomycetota bacterium]
MEVKRMGFDEWRRHDRAVGNLQEHPSASLGLFIPAFCGLTCSLLLLSPVPIQGVGLSVFLVAAIGVVALMGEQAIQRWPSSRPLVHPLLSALLIYALYSSLGRFVPSLIPEDREWFLLAVDRRFLGFDWEAWFQAWANPWVTDGLQAVYASFYFFPLLLGLAFAFQRKWAVLYAVTDRVILGFLLTYCGYFLVPARSPNEFLEYSMPLPSFGLQESLHTLFVETSFMKWDCFPSGHTMMSAFVAWCAWQRLGRARWLFVSWSALTILATLYLRYHYLVDVLVGFVGFLLWVWISERLFGRLRELEAAAPLESVT